MKKFLKVMIAVFLLPGNFAHADVKYSCPTPDRVNCVPATNVIGRWHSNDTQMTGNTFTHNNRCSNIITLANNDTRLVCCYSNCGVFYMDVSATRCVKVSTSDFVCQK